MTGSECETQSDHLRALFTAQAGGCPISSVSVVGNAPMDPSPGRAKRIDTADLVLRLTTFCVDVDGEPSALGRRTDVVVLHRGVLAGPSTFADYRSRVYLMAEPGRLHWEPERAPTWWPVDLGAMPISNREFAIPLIDELGLDRRRAVWATTGTLAVWLVKNVLPDARVLLTGMSLLTGDPTRTRFEHAWGGDVPVTVEHDLGAERAALGRWMSDGWLEVLE